MMPDCLSAERLAMLRASGISYEVREARRYPTDRETIRRQLMAERRGQGGRGVEHKEL